MNPSRMVRCDVCASISFKRADRGEHTEAMAEARKRHREQRPTYSEQKEASEMRAKARREAYRKPAKANRHNRNRRRMA